MSPRDPLPPDEEAVRRLLAEARHDEPAPPEVVARLDAVLADLAAGREPGTSPSTQAATRPVDELVARRRRRRAWGAAAAAVVVVGLGGTVLQQGGVDSLTAASLSDESAGDADAGGSGRASPEARSEADDLSTLRADGRRLVPDRLAPQVRRLLRSPAVADTTDPMSTADSTAALDRAIARCGAEPGPGDRAVPVSYDGAAAVLVVRPDGPRGTVVDVVVCGRPGVARSLLLPR